MTEAIAIRRDKSLILIHDVVNHFVAGGDRELAPVLSNISALLAAARGARWPIVFATPGQGDPAIAPRGEAGKLAWGSKGCEVPDLLMPRPDETILRKPRYGAFFGSGLEAHMRRCGADTLILCGISLAGGVETTVRDAHNRDLGTVLVADACLCRPIPDQGWGAVSREEVEKVTLSLLAQRFARIATTAEICRAIAAASPPQ
jgi:ureidoacrylate peracid hydrolase